ncbi:MAG: tetratricopeptide repeat protein [Betaproteobacteria bacterium]|nr:tetratricopeptide repeat protein [Betaproteobacteria bacterium]
MSFSIRKFFTRDVATPSALVAPADDRRRAQELVDRGVAAEDSGAAAQALQCYRRAIEADAGFAPAHLNLGIALQAARDLAAAIACYQRAIRLDPGYAAAHYNLAMVHLISGEYAQAEGSFRAALKLRAGFPEAYVGLADALEALGRNEDALAALDIAIGQREHYAGALLNAGTLLQKMGHLSQAEARLREIPEDHAEYLDAVVLRAAMLHAQGRANEAEACFRRAVEIKPEFHQAHNDLGNVLRGLGRLPEAEASYRRALDLEPDFYAAHSNLGNVLKDFGRLPEAEACYRRALELNRDFHEAHNNLGNALLELSRPDEAVRCYRRALELKPDYHVAHSNLGNALRSLGRLSEAETSYRRALELKPDYDEAHSSLLFCLGHNQDVDAPALFAEHCRFGEVFETPLRALWPQHANSRDPDRGLRIGFVSGELLNHAVAFFIEPVLAQLAGYPQLSLHAYSNNAFEDAVTRRLRGLFAHWHPIVGLSDAALAERVRDDGIDILVDLSGHTGKYRLLSFARKPAPVQASWIGYPGTTGLRAVDYYLADRFFLPPGEFDAQFTEKIVRLPAYLAFLPSETAPRVNSLPALSNAFVTFGSFNRPGKLSRAVIAVWSQLLRALPGARMVLGAMPDDGSKYALIEWFAAEGIPPERLDFHARCAMNAYLGLHRQVDLCLDTFPYSGGTTTLHALWMGVPTLTLAGDTVPGRIGAGTLGHFGLDAFVAHDAEDFVRRGTSWAGDISALAGLRAGLRERFEQSLIGQPAMVAAGMERALRTMWRRWCAGLPAASFEVQLQDISR